MIQRTNIGIFGKINAGKSTLMNLITDQVTSIVDPTYGTTTDIKVSLIGKNLNIKAFKKARDKARLKKSMRK